MTWALPPTMLVVGVRPESDQGCLDSPCDGTAWVLRTRARAHRSALRAGDVRRFLPGSPHRSGHEPWSRSGSRAVTTGGDDSARGPHLEAATTTHHLHIWRCPLPARSFSRSCRDWCHPLLTSKTASFRAAHSVPEGVNRAAVDRLSDLSLTHSESANANLRCECASPERIHFVGNVMIGSVLRLQPRWQEGADRAFGELAQEDGVARCAGPRMLTSGAPIQDKARSQPDPRALP